MYRNLLLALFAAASVQAQAPSFSISLTSENGGADTRFTLSYTGVPAWAAVDPGAGGSVGIYGDLFFSLPNQNFTFLTATSGSYSNSSPSRITGLDTGLYWTNTTTGQASTLDFIRFDTNVGILAIVYRGGFMGGVEASPGQQIVLSGPTSVSFLSGLAFSNFNAGSWTGQSTLFSPGWSPNYVTILNVGTAIPEPSTYGLILGGLALAGAAIRRRKSAK